MENFPSFPTRKLQGQPLIALPLATREPDAGGILQGPENQLALRQLISEYLIPAETNVIWYALGSVLAIVQNAVAGPG